MSSPPAITPDYTNSGGVQSVSGGKDISITGTSQNPIVNQINIPISNRASGTTPLLITATTLGTAQTIGNLSLTTTAIYDIDVVGVVVLRTSSNTKYDMNLFITIDGVQQGQVFTSSMDGVNHYLTMPIQCSLLNASASPHTILIRGYANAGSIITALSFQIMAIGHLS